MIRYPSPVIPVDQSTLCGQAVLRCYCDYQPEGSGANLEENNTSTEIITLFRTSRSFSPLGREKGPFLPARKEGQGHLDIHDDQACSLKCPHSRSQVITLPLQTLTLT